MRPAVLPGVARGPTLTVACTNTSAAVGPLSVATFTGLALATPTLPRVAQSPTFSVQPTPRNGLSELLKLSPGVPASVPNGSDRVVVTSTGTVCAVVPLASPPLRVMLSSVTLIVTLTTPVWLG